MAAAAHDWKNTNITLKDLFSNSLFLAWGKLSLRELPKGSWPPRWLAPIYAQGRDQKTCQSCEILKQKERSALFPTPQRKKPLLKHLCGASTTQPHPSRCRRTQRTGYVTRWHPEAEAAAWLKQGPETCCSAQLRISASNCWFEALTL